MVMVQLEHTVVVVMRIERRKGAMRRGQFHLMPLKISIKVDMFQIKVCIAFVFLLKINNVMYFLGGAIYSSDEEGSDFETRRSRKSDKPKVLKVSESSEESE